MRTFVAALILGSFVTSAASADDILVFQRQNSDPQGGDAAGAEAAEVLESLGHEVTLVASMSASLPADLSVFDTIWVVQLVALSGPDETKLVDYVNSGGGLYLTGERSCCAGLNAQVQNTVARLATSRWVFPSTDGASDEFTAVTAQRHGIPTTPNDVPTWYTVAPGVMTGVDPRFEVYELGTTTGAAAMVGEELKRGSGCVYVAMDITFWFAEPVPGQDNAALAENIERFLSTCNDRDGDGLSDPGEADASTLADDPDSDDDGLCDGHATVPGTCVDGESVFTNSDSDGVADPLDDDDDGDGIPTSLEVAAEALAPDVDGDERPAWLDLDSDNNFISDAIEGTKDRNGNGIPGFVERDDDPQPCNEDADCAGVEGSRGCNFETEYCFEEAETIPDGGVPDSGTVRDAAVVAADAATRSTTSDGGCDCRVPGQRPTFSGLGLLALAFATLAARRGRRRVILGRRA